ncbi:MAG: hypothetical protein CMD29_04075 [Flavobacteriales bacterium]|nr:hypothetical protein [Flavobacteriales bacterium]
MFKNSLKLLNVFCIDNRKISIFIFIYFIILNFWFVNLSNNFKVNQIIEFENQNFYFTPYITFLVHKIITSFFSIEIMGYITIVIIPLFILFLTYKIFNFFISSKFSFLLALLTQSVYNNFNLRDVFFNINNISELLKKDYLLIFNFPFPSISILLFLLVFYQIISNRRMSDLNKITLYTLLIFSFFYVNALDSFFLIPIWILILLFDFKKISLKNKVFQLILGNIVLLPGLFYGSFKQIHEYSNVNLYNIILYNVFPLILSLILYFVKRIDLNEVWFKFKIIYLFNFIEIFITLLVYLKIFNINLETANKQILQFPIHMMYYLPLIYYLKRNPFKYNYGIESKSLSIRISKISYFIFEKTKNYLFYSLILLIFYFILPR